MKRAVIAGLALVATGLQSAATANPITFLDATTASGSIGGIPFTGASIIISAAADTANIQTMPSSEKFIDNASATVAIAGLGTFTFTTPTRFFVYGPSQIVGFSRAGVTGLDLINGPVNAAFGAWDMTTSIGPSTGAGTILQWSDIPVQTSGGALVLYDAIADITFSAQVQIPEPGSLLVLALAVPAIGLIKRRKNPR